MIDRITWKLLFIFSLAMSIFATYEAFNTPEILAPTHPAWVGVALFTLDLLVLVGSFGVAFRKQILFANFWKAVVVLYSATVCTSLIFEYSAGGYYLDEIVFSSLLMLLLLLVIVLPVIRYVQDFKSAAS